MTPTFLRLARRFHIWLEPLLYETISDHHPGQITTVIAFISSDSKPPSFFQTTVRRLYLSQYNSVSRVNTLKILQLCINVEDLVDLGHFVTPQLLPVVASLPLRRVAINVDQLSDFGTVHRIDFAPLVLPFLTHLSTVDSHIFMDAHLHGPVSTRCFPRFAARLAYLSTNWTIGWHTLGQILEACPKLEVLIPIELVCGQNALQFTAPLFYTLSHLELRGNASSQEIPRIWTGLSCLPKLTHVAFDTISITSLTPALTMENKRLRCILYTSWGDEEDRDDVEIFRLLSEDPRFVCIEL
ncbi:hypothetical protein C8R45DRAFT_1096807 [Mycena sanguinolenta]|nr:hypothetical protein C8R45DRAFT_1096807 [Mycena sanguinolenta]